MTAAVVALVVILLAIVVLAGASVRILREYDAPDHAQDAGGRGHAERDGEIGAGARDHECDAGDERCHRQAAQDPERDHMGLRHRQHGGKDEEDEARRGHRRLQSIDRTPRQCL